MPDGGDVLHCNTIEYIRPEMLPEGYSGPLRPGSVLLSFRAIDLVCAVDLEEEIVYSANTQYGGNTIGLKKLAMRLAINHASNEEWLTKPMLVWGGTWA